MGFRKNGHPELLQTKPGKNWCKNCVMMVFRKGCINKRKRCPEYEPFCLNCNSSQFIKILSTTTQYNHTYKYYTCSKCGTYLGRKFSKKELENVIPVCPDCKTNDFVYFHMFGRYFCRKCSKWLSE